MIMGTHMHGPSGTKNWQKLGGMVHKLMDKVLPIMAKPLKEKSKWEAIFVELVATCQSSERNGMA